ncbi:MAG: mannosyltransferase family protein [Kyrpidia sp.]|nr:mannosyltransferase family protein [Kyrpidia sp.]
MERWRAWAYAAGLFALHKMAVWGGSVWFSLDKHPLTPLIPFLHYALIQNFSRWDTAWYIGIAAHGYRTSSAAFFPLFPYLIRYVHQWTGFSYPDSAWFIANIFFFFALYMVAKLFLLDQPSRITWRALVLLIWFPTAFFFACGYTEPLFLFFTAGSLYFSRTGRFWTAGVFGLFASLTRNTGLALVLPFLYEYFRARDFKWQRIGPDLAAVALIPAGLELYMGLLDRSLGDPLAFVHAQRFWKRFFMWPWDTVRAGTLELWIKPLRGWSWIIHAFTVAVVWAELVFLALAPLVRRWRIPVSYYLFAAASVVVPLLSPSRDWYFLSISRFALVLFPLFLIAGRMIKSRWAFVAISLASAAGLLIALANFSKGYFVA